MSRYDNKSTKQLHKIAWKHFSEYIRRKSPICFTCDARKSWKELQAGHYIHTNRLQHWLLDFNELNVKPQCIRCNNYLSGNTTEYARKLVQLYGPDVLEELNLLKHKEYIISRDEAIEYVKKYLELKKGLSD